MIGLFTNDIDFAEVCDDVPDMDGLLMEIIEHRLVETCNNNIMDIRLYGQLCSCSACGWDHVLQGLVMLGLNLMEVYAPKSASKFSTLES